MMMMKIDSREWPPLRRAAMSAVSVTLVYSGETGWMDQDETWHGARSRPRGPGYIVLDGDQARRKGHNPIFGPCPLWPNGWMDEDATWCQGRPQPRRHCVRWGPSSPPQKGGHSSPQFSAHVWPNG